MEPLAWDQRLAQIVAMMREMSAQRDPQAMVRAYSARVSKLLQTDGFLAVSRRDLPAPRYRITRSSRWTEEINPWRDKHRLPLLQGGLLGELLYAEEPRIIDDLQVSPDDPAGEYFEGHRSLVAIPMFDQGQALNMVVRLARVPGFFPRDTLPEEVWIANMFGRATHNLVLSDQLRQAYAQVDRELQAVSELQRSLLPASLPSLPTLELAASYQTSRAAGGDYYDALPLPDGRWGLLVADVAGHGTPAAVVMAITHTLVHVIHGPGTPPGDVLAYLNAKLCTRFVAGSGAFVTAFFGHYDPATRSLDYSSAGHNPPRVYRPGGEVLALEASHALPLGIDEDEVFRPYRYQFTPGETILFFTDGIIEAHNPQRQLFGLERLDAVVRRACAAASARQVLEQIVAAVDAFADGEPAEDDRTLLVGRIR